MKTLRGLEVAGAIYLGDGLTPVVVGDTVRLYLDTDANEAFPEFIEGTVVAPITPVECGAKLSYNVEYDETDLEGSANLIRIQDAVDWRGVSQIEELAETVAGYLPLTGGTLTGTLTIDNGVASAPIVLDSDEGSITLGDGSIVLSGLSGEATFGSISLITALAPEYGGTGASGIPAARTIFGFPSYPSLANANAGEGLTGSVFWDTVLGKYRSTTASS